MAGIRANLAPGYALADGIEAVQQAVDELGLPPGYSTRVMGRARELERTLQEFVWTCALSFVCMYIVLAAQYEHLDSPDHDSAVAADRGAVRPVQPVARRRNAQPVLGPRHSRAVRHGEEGVDPADRSHQPAARGRHAARRRRFLKATATACGRF